jgi:sugar phosphate permease
MSSLSRSPSEHRLTSGPIPGENRLLWTVWFTYGAFYFCRTNLSAAVPGLKASAAEGGLGLSAIEVGYILAALKIAYAAGQLFNGQLSEQVGPRKLLAIGMFGTAALNVLFGFGAALYFLIFVWACNGYAQSLGWTPCIRAIANWFPVSRRGKAIGIVGTGYQLTAGATFVVSGLAAEAFGWRGAVWVSAGIMVVAATAMLLLLEERPPHLGGMANASSLPTYAGGSEGPRQAHRTPSSDELLPSSPAGSAWRNLWLTLSNPALWLLGVSLGLLDACRYGYVDWGLAHLKDVQQTGVGVAALKYAVLPGGAIAGSYAAGWASDRFFGSRRAPVTCILLIVLGLLTLTYDWLARASVPGTILLLVLIGFCIYGPQVLLVGTAPADLARNGTSAAAAGFVNCMGYMGAALGDVFTGYSIHTFGWPQTIQMWAIWAFVAAIAAGLLWNARGAAERLGVSK